MSANSVSLLGQAIAQSKRLGDLRVTMDSLSREITTGQTADSYSGLGTQAQPLQNLNALQPLLQSYQTNVDTVSNKMTLMNNALTNISTVGNQLISALQTQLQNDPTDIASIRQVAQQ